MKKKWGGLRALVTGGTRGIGKAIVEELQGLGVKVLFTGTKPKPGYKNYYVVDFSDSNAVEIFADAIRKEPIDILINNAGINAIGEFEKLSLDTFKVVNTVNVIAPFLLCKAVIPYMKKKKWGRIINLSSIFGKVSKAFRAPYSASKFAIDGMTAALALEVAPYGILANCVAPGFIQTDLTMKILGRKGIEQMIKTIPMKRTGTPEEVARFVTWLAGPDNTFITAQNIAIDGGFTRG